MIPRGLTVALLILVVRPVPATQQRFEDSSITACPPTTATQTGTQFMLGAIRPVGLHIEHTRVAVMCVTVDVLIHMAYNGGRYGHQNAAGRDVIGGPSWIRSERYTIEGSADAVRNPDLTGAMMRNFLEDRFQLRVRRHVDDAQMYALKVARGGLKITPVAPSDCVATSKGSMSGTLRIWDACPATLTTVANMFDLDRNVIDKTGVKDRFAVHLEIETAPTGAITTAAVIQAFEEQLGLTLASTKGRRAWVQIESIDKPNLR